VEIEPPELAQLVDFAERPRADDWSLRSALVRYAQPQPVRVETILDLVRRIEWALRSHAKLIEREGHALWAALDAGDDPAGGPNAPVVELLRTAAEVDHLGDVLAAWASDPRTERPDAAVDAVTAEVAQRLDALGVPREERTGPPRKRAARA
jgi:hypothetical protein